MEFKGQLTVDVQFVTKGWPQALNPVIADDVYGICREALANAFRHAKATRVDVTIEYTSNTLGVQVVDDGRGVGLDVIQSGLPGHWGIRGMRERADRIHAALEITSHPNAGTRVNVVVPGKVIFRSHAS